MKADRVSQEMKTTEKRNCGRNENGMNIAKPENEDHFLRLPAELLLCILTMVADLKPLLQCLLVSKHFASVVSLVKSVSLTIPRIKNCSNEYYKILNMIPSAPLVSLGKFRQLESIYLEYKYLEDSVYSSVIKWKVKFSEKFPDIEKFVVFSSVLAQKQAAYIPYQEQVSFSLVQHHVFALNQIMDFYRLSRELGRHTEWIFIIYMLAKSRTSLKRVIITDFDKKGKMVVGDKQLVKVRSRIHNPGEKLFQFPLGVESFGTPELNLPLSGYIMSDARLQIFTNPTEANASAIDEIVSWDFEDDGEVFGEAVKEFHKNHRDNFNYEEIPPM